MSDFKKILAALNPEQRRAVEQIEGPVAVIAGPGTGKTQLLAARIGQILTETDTLPQAILCLTYTDAAAHEMRERLLKIIGSDAHRVPISTFHSFCNRVIQENPTVFDRHDLEPIADLERIDIVRRLLDALSPEHPLRRGRRDPYFFEGYLVDFFGLMKRENWTPRDVAQATKAFLADLPTREDFIYKKKTKENLAGDLKTDKIISANRQMEWVIAAADLFPKYKWAMENARRYDFEDMIGWVLLKFSQDKSLLRMYQERFLYFLVDEFQDTNGAQNHLLNQLAEFWDAPNVFIVGDDDQAIFEFQGARLKNLTDFLLRHASRIRKIVLSENYRSTQKILDSAKKVIDRNELRITQLAENQGVTKILTARNTDVLKNETEPRVLVFENRIHEIAEIVAEIEQLKNDGQNLEEVAIIVVQHRQAEKLMTLLERKNIPFQTRRPANVLDQPIIRQFVFLLKYLEKSTREPLGDALDLFKILHFRFLGFSGVEVAQAFHEKKSDKHFRLQLIDNQRFSRFSEILDGWLSTASELPLPTFLEKIVAESGLLGHILAQPEKIWLLECLTTFLQFATAETGRQPRISLTRFCEMLDQLDQNKLQIGVQQTLGTGDGIKILTAHGAKGLEFEHVYLLDCTVDFWEKPRLGGRRFVLPDTLTLSNEADKTESQRRLFYVAMTRAKRKLTMSYAEKNEAGKKIAAAIFIHETEIKPTQVTVNQAVMLDSQVAMLLENNRLEAEILSETLLNERLEGFVLNVSSLNRFLRCPLAFYYEDVIRVPRSATESSLFGEAIHFALARFFEKMRTSEKHEFGTIDDLCAHFEQKMEAWQGRFSETGFLQKLTHGKSILTRFFEEEGSKFSKNSLTERKFDRIELDGVPIAGVIDRIDFREGGRLHVIDYKVSRPENAASSKMKSPSEEQPIGGDYWRQLIFYKILLEKTGSLPNLPRGAIVESGSLIWLETGQKDRFSIKNVEFSPENVFLVKNQIKESWLKITRHEFSVGCGKTDCAWCRVHLDNRSASNFVEADAEGEDDFLG
jgi:DNA helicase II / ATP-dependent DNA helicase PcrA